MLELTIVTNKKTVFSEQVVSIIAPGSIGYLGILNNHAPLLTSLIPGKLTVKKPGGHTDLIELTYAISGGILEVSNNKISILADACDSPEEIDLERAKNSMQRAKQRIKTASTDSSIDVARAEAALARALNRIRISEQYCPL